MIEVVNMVSNVRVCMPGKKSRIQTVAGRTSWWGMQELCNSSRRQQLPQKWNMEDRMLRRTFTIFQHDQLHLFARIAAEKQERGVSLGKIYSNHAYNTASNIARRIKPNRKSRGESLPSSHPPTVINLIKHERSAKPFIPILQPRTPLTLDALSC
jgi:hypothetical protein